MTDHNDHYFSPQPTSSSHTRSYSFLLDDRQFEITTDSGIFSSDRLDKGTSVLLDSYLAHKLPPAPDMSGDVLDLGCGAGPLSVALAHLYPDNTIWAVDVNERARQLCAGNARANKASNIVVAAPEDVPTDLTFSLIWSNPPIRIGKDALHELLLTWLQRLDVHGIAHFVVSKHLGADSLAKWLEQHNFTVRRSASSKGFRVLSVTHRVNINTDTAR